ncbi:MAG: homing endonuclease [Parcubacteria group bacterium Gr01-1014_17]|nr:MAG: homing endonuclease [Parcubacteria group bacterium Gr01-1014_17]
MKLNKRQKAIIVGSILGDAYVQATGKKNARLRYEHGGKQKSYLFWKVKELQPLFNGTPRYLERKHPISGETYSYWRHQSFSNELLGYWRKFFYPHGIKCIPKTLAFVLYFSPKKTERLHKIISPFMLPMFAYKLCHNSLTP